MDILTIDIAETKSLPFLTLPVDTQPLISSSEFQLRLTILPRKMCELSYFGYFFL